MWILLAVTLAVGMLYTTIRLARHHRALARLHGAITRRQPFLREEVPGASGPHWDAVCQATNELITELRQLERDRSGQLTQLEATLGSLQEAVLIVDASNYVVLANRALQAIFPRARNILHQRLEVVLSNIAFHEYLEAVRQDTAEPQHQVEFAEGNHRRWVEATGTKIPPLNGDRGPWVLFVLHDITKQKQLELVRKEFVANVSHELRTPLSVIKGYIETLDESHEEMPLADRARFLRTIHRHTERLNSLLEDLLTLSRLESINPGLRRELTDFAALLQDIAGDFRARPAGQSHVIDCEVERTLPALSVDPLKITQVVENLLDNALKYTPAGSRVILRAAQQGSEVVVTVRDNGPGIPTDDLPHIFERFYRVEKGRSREKGGTGLGLSIVKHIVQLHGGRVWAESELGRGTTFFFTLPVPAIVS